MEETRGLLERYGPVKALDSLGYRQARSVLDGTMSAEEAIKAAQQGHRNYAKRQMTWFRREPEVRWIEGFGDEAETVRAGGGVGSRHACMIARQFKLMMVNHPFGVHAFPGLRIETGAPTFCGKREMAD